MKYPPSKQQDIQDDFHGTLVPDPYRWLEDGQAPETRAWLQAQQALSETFLATVPGREAYRTRLTELWNYPRYSPPDERQGQYYFSKNDGLQNQPILYRQTGLDGPPEPLLDPNRLSDDGTVALMNRSFTDDGTLMAYSLSASGSDWQEVRIMETATGRVYDDLLQWAKFTSLAWTPDNAGFFYSRFPNPAGQPDLPPSTHHRVYYHRLGTPQSADELVYARPEAPNLAFDPTVTADGRYLVLHVWHGTDVQNRLYYRPIDPAHPAGGDLIRLLDEADAAYHFIGSDGPRFYLHTNLDAPRGRIIAIDLAHPGRAQWQEILPQQEDTLDQATIIKQQFVVLWLHHASHRLHRYNLDGTPAGEIPLPGLGSITQLTGRPGDSACFFDYQSYIQPPTIFRYDLAGDALSAWQTPATPFDPAGYETHQVFYPSKDGTRVPMFLTHKKGLVPNGDLPTLLYGYGGFSISHTPLFSPAWLIWLEQGGVLADANLRGGNEYGEAWHQAGMLANKQNVFDDFIAAAEWLIGSGYTRPGQLAITGRSNGGLLVAACLLQRPELFGSVICVVPVIDMLRYHRFTVGRFWTGEYGNAEANADHFRFLYAYSPLHNIRPGVVYPPTLIATADTDDRVVPLHSFKFAATLQTAAPAGGNPLLLRVETRAGHGLGKPTTKLIAEWADIYAFLAATLGK